MRWIMIFLAATLMAGGARANDSVAELATGGLVFTKSDAIEMRAEDLFISMKQVRVRYRFFNKSDSDITSLVAFPMPDIKTEQDADIALPTEDPQNLLGFSTRVDGKALRADLEQKAIANGIDQTELLRSLGVPLAPHLQGTNRALDGLPREQWERLVGLGLAEVTEYGTGQGMEKHLEARWTLKTTYFWKQTFPARREIVIEHQYQPSLGASVQTSLAGPASSKEDWFAEYQRKYCMDRDFLNAVDRARRSAKSEFGAPLAEYRLAYVLKTGANWAGPIKNFRLVVDKGDASSLLSFCGEGVNKIAATRFEVRKRDFVPTKDLLVLILKRLPTNR
jgi:hypothetical protein